MQTRNCGDACPLCKGHRNGPPRAHSRHSGVIAALAGRPVPYADDELRHLAAHCTRREDDAGKVERQSYKSAAAMLLAPHVGRRFDGIITGASAKGTWVRLFHPPVEGRMTRGFKGLDVGDVVRVRLAAVDVERGFIDFEKSKG